MSAFEATAYSWYFANFTRFAMETGMVAGLVRNEGLAGFALRLFVRALGMTHVMAERVQRERAEAESGKG